MDIKDLDKKQLILLTLLITFVVSIATGIVTVSLMNQMPKSVPQTINNVIQRTIERVTTVPAPAPKVTDTTIPKDSTLSLFENSDALVSIFLNNTTPASASASTISTDSVTKVGTGTTTAGVDSSEPSAIGQGIIISDIGLVLVDSSIIKDQESYKVVLNKTDFNVTVLKKFDNGFTVLKISPIVVGGIAKPKTGLEASAINSTGISTSTGN